MNRSMAGAAAKGNGSILSGTERKYVPGTLECIRRGVHPEGSPIQNQDQGHKGCDYATDLQKNAPATKVDLAWAY
jgi:hypothetical protein